MNITNFNKGEKIKIVDVDYITQGSMLWKDGDIVEIRNIELNGCDRLDVWDKDKSCSEYIYSNEFPGIKKINESYTNNDNNQQSSKNKSNIEKHTPTILDDQEKVINWSKKMQEQHISFPSIIEYLVSNKKSSSSISADGLEEIRAIYNSKNHLWKEQLLNALFLNRYRLQNDIEEGQIVTNGNVVGFVRDIDYENRVFKLSNDKNEKNTLGMFNIDSFKKI